MKKPAGPALNTRTCLCSPSRTRKGGKLTSYWKVVNYFLETYATDDTISEAGLDIMNLKQPAEKGVVE